MIVISDALVLATPYDIDANSPRIAWHNLVTPAVVSATQEATDEPVRNLANPATYLVWRGTSTALQYVTVSLAAAEEADYFAIARHNFGSTGAAVKLQSSADASTWADVTDPVTPSDDNVLIYEFDEEFKRYYRLHITPGSAAPSIAVFYLGLTMPLQRRIYVGHTPLPFGRKSIVTTGRSENGQFLGRVLRRRILETSVELQNLTASWYRSTFDPFVEHAETLPFFWAWRPETYPGECGYAWLTSDPKVTNQRANGMMQVSLQMQGIR